MLRPPRTPDGGFIESLIGPEGAGASARSPPATSRAPVTRQVRKRQREGLAHAFAVSSGNQSWTFAYSPASQVTASTGSNTAWDWAGGPATSANNTADGLNRDATIAAASGYDADGNLIFDGTRHLTYDGENRLLTESGPVAMTLTYDPMGRLAQGVINGATTQFLYDGDNLVAEYDGSNTVLRRYVHGPGVDNPLVWFEGSTVSASNANYLIADRQGSIAATANTSGATPPTIPTTLTACPTPGAARASATPARSNCPRPSSTTTRPAPTTPPSATSSKPTPSGTRTTSTSTPMSERIRSITSIRPVRQIIYCTVKYFILAVEFITGHLS